MRTLLLFLCCSLLVSSFVTAQTAPLPAKEALIKVLNKQVRYPRELSEKKVSSVFSLKISFSDNGKIAKVAASKYFPEKMRAQLTNADLFAGINWEEIFKRKVNANDALIIPFVVYNPMENNATFYEYTMEDLFAYDDHPETFAPCLIMQTYALHYQDPIR